MWTQNDVKSQIKVPLLLLEDIGSLLYTLLSTFHPDWLIELPITQDL